MGRVVTVMALLVAVAAMTAGCAKQAALPSAGTGGSTSTSVPGPRVTKLPNGTSRVIGTLRHLDLEGGLWVIQATLPGGGANAKTLAVITNPELFDIVALTGKYVEAVGTIDTKAVSTNMAGAQMQAKTIRAVSVGK
jgi:hypothetical protein